MRETRFSFCSSRMSLCLIAFVIVAFAPDNIHAQDQAKNDRPSVGLVLSGGGARGAAHVGVIKVLDELRIPIDYIAGTSMGAIVGGLYASGMSADELETVIASADWTALLRDRPPRARRSFRRKSDDIGFLIDFELGIDKSGLILPSGLVQGQNLEIALKRFVLPAISINDFDALPIPFRAVATDMVAGEAVILDSGDLATAMRASMSAPGIFKPVRQDGRILVDGGIENNLPVQIVRDMGADILIVVDVGFPLLPEEQLNSALAVTNQMLTILINSRARDQAALLTPNDILITPNLGDFGSQDFHRMLKAQTLGSKKALELQGRLASLSVSKEKYVDYRNRLEMNRRGLPVIDKVVVENESKLSPKVIEARLSAQEGELFDPDQLERDISNIYGFDTFETVSYDLLDRRGATTLAVRATKKSWGPNYMRFGINLEDDFDGASSYNIAARFTRTEINRKGGEFRAEVQIGASPRLFAEFYQPLDFASRWFVNPRIEYSRESSGLFDAGRQIAQFRSNQTELSLDGGRQFGNWGELRVGLTRSRSNAALQIGAPSFDDSRSVDLAGISSIFATDTIDRFAIPKSGTNFSLGWTGFRESLGSDATFDIAGLFFLNAQTWGNHTILNWWNLASTVNDKSGGIVPFALGGLFNLSGYGAEQISGKHMGIGRLLYYYRLGEKTLPVLDTPIYVGTSIEVGKVWQNSDAVGLDKTQVAGSVFIVVDTLLGPLYVAYGAGEGGQRSAHLFLGQTF